MRLLIPYLAATLGVASIATAQDDAVTPTYTAYPMTVCAGAPPADAQCVAVPSSYGYPAGSAPAPHAPQPYYAPNPYTPYPSPMPYPAPYGQPYGQPYGYGPPAGYGYPQLVQPNPVQVQFAPPMVEQSPVSVPAEDLAAVGTTVEDPATSEHAVEAAVPGSPTAQLRQSLRQSAATLHFRGLSPDGTDEVDFAGLGLGFRRDVDPNWTLSVTTDVLFNRQDGTEFAAAPVAASAIAHFFPMSRVDPFVTAGAGVSLRATPFGSRADDFAQMLLYCGAGLDVRVWNLQLIVEARRVEVTSELLRDDGTAFGLLSGIEGSFALGGVW